jgi:hypothetical protein
MTRAIRLLAFACLAPLFAASMSASAQTILPGGSVAQDAAFFRDGATGKVEIAVAYAFSDEVRVYARASDAAPWALEQAYPVGSRPGVQDDLPRRLVVVDFDRDGLDDLLVLNSGNFLAAQPGSLQWLRGGVDGAFETYPAHAIGTELTSPRTPPSRMSMATARSKSPWGTTTARAPSA